MDVSPSFKNAVSGGFYLLGGLSGGLWWGQARWLAALEDRKKLS